MNPTLLLQIALGGICLMFLINCFICYKNIHALAVMMQPGYRQDVLLRTDMLKHELATQAAQRNFCFINIALMVLAVVPLLTALVILSK
jgi:hypothetical protein